MAMIKPERDLEGAFVTKLRTSSTNIAPTYAIAPRLKQTSGKSSKP